MKTSINRKNGFYGLLAGFCICWQLPHACAQAPGPGSALSLDGTNGYVQVPNGTWFNGNFTIEGWVFARSYNSWSRLLDFANGDYTNGVYLALSSGTNGFPTMGVLNSSSSPLVTSGSVLPLNQWVHLACTFSNGIGTIYMNGVLVGSGPQNTPPPVIRTNNYMGRSSFAMDGYANAVFDEVRIWNVARTQGQIQGWMHRSLVGNEPGLAGYWRFDEGSGANTADSTGGSAPASLAGRSSWTNSTVPMIAGAGSAVSFNSALGQFVNVPHQAALNSYPLTVMAWFNSPSTNFGSAMVNKYVSSSYNGYQLFMSGGHLLGWYIRDSVNNVFNGGPMDAGPVNDGIWHHAAMVIDATGGRLYLDGVLKSSLPWSGTAGPVTTTEPLTFGLYPGDSFFAGQVDEVSLWNASLSSNQIQGCMGRSLSDDEAGLLGYWRLDEGSGTNTMDSSNHGNNGTLNGNPAWVASGARLIVRDPGYAVNLTPANSAYLQAPSGVWFNADFTVEGWVYVRSYSSWSRLIDFANGPNTDNIFLALSAGTGGFPTMGVYTNNNGVPNFSATSQLPLNQWTHLAATLSGTTGTIYINGNPVGGGTLNRPRAVVRTNNYVGRSNYAVDGYADALFDEIRIWNVARSQSQIQQTMGTPLNGTEPGLVGYWRLNEGTGTTTVDGTGNGNNLTLVNGPIWVNASLPTLSFVNAGIGPDDLGSVAWGDLNNDGRLDVLLTGAVHSDGAEMWQNQGNGTFIQITNGMAGLGGLYYSSAQWGDCDNDGRLDVLVTGTQNGSVSFGVSQVWRNLGNGTFSNLNLAVPGVLNSSVAWGDFDNDGKLDFLVTGARNGNQPFTQVWRNLGNGVFTNLNLPLPQVQAGSVALADFNRDGYLDILITGAGNSGDIAQVWLNQGNATFTNLPLALPGVYQSAVAVADFNNDGYPDIVLTGLNSSGNPIAQVWQNLGNGSFSNLNVPLPGVSSGSVAVGDYDNDGLVDILLTGGTTLSSGNPAGPISQVWHNQGNGSFSNVNANLQGVYSSSAAWGDFNSDGRLGILLSGQISPGNNTSIVYQTVAPFANSPPTAPTALQAVPGTNGVLLSWNAATDSQTPASGLSYNVRIGTNSGGFSVVSPEANPATGLRLLPQMGNAQERLSYQFNNHLALGTTYYWSVQAIDGGYAGSPFAAEGQFIVGGPTVLTGPANQIDFSSATLTGSANPNGQNTAAWFQYGTTTNYGLTTQVVNIAGTNTTAVSLTNSLTGLQAGAMYHYRLVGTNSVGTNSGGDYTFTTPAAVAPLATTTAASGPSLNPALNGLVTPNGADTTVWFEWGATTNYGNLTPATLINATNAAAVPVGNALGALPAQLYHFQLVASNSAGVTLGGDLTFVIAPVTNIASTISGTSLGSVAWGDFNNDGLPDLLITGDTNGSVSGVLCQVWQNLGNGSFSNINVSLPGVSSSAAAWGDFDNDGYLDILLTGQNTSGQALAQVWHNNGDGTFSLLTTAVLPAVYNSAVALADFDRDGKLDILLTGTDSSNTNFVSQVWRNDGDGTFSNWNVPLPGVNFGSVAVGDFDRDGFPDILLTGKSSTGSVAQVWHNLGNGTFTNLNAGLPGFEYSSVAVADFDADGWPDLLLTGGSSIGVISDVWHNNRDGTFTELNTTLPGVYYSAVAIGDFDNDGLPDILLSGTPDGFAASAICQLWRNTGNGSFTNFPITLPGAWVGSVAFGDFNGDGRLDFIVTGYDTNEQASLGLWANTSGPSNTPPTAPTGLSAVAGAASVTLIWNPASDAQTSAPGLSYNMRLGTSTGGAQIISPESGLASGTRRVPQIGNAGEALIVPVTNLSLGATYYWSVQAIDAAFAGSPFGAEASFVVGQPGVITGSPVQLLPTSEELTGSVNPNGFASIAWFQWGTNTSYGNTTAATNLSASTTFVAVSNVLAGLTQGAAYHYRLMASNSFGLSIGNDAIFTTPVAPTVVTLAASGTVPTSTTLNGTVLPNAGATTAWFAYGTSASYGNTTAPVSISASNTSPVPLNNVLIGLAPATTYHFQLFGSNIAGLNGGGDKTVTTPAVQPPLANTLAASAITPNRATLNATVTPGGSATTAGFLWGTNGSFGNQIGVTVVNATNLNAIAYSNSLQGLVAGTLYDFRAVATNSAAISFGPILTFTTLPVSAPTPATLPANVVNTTSAILNGSVNPNGADTGVWFKYDTTTNYGSTTALVLVSSNSAAAVPASRLVSGLIQGALYHFQLAASNRLGTVTGLDLTFLPSALVATNAGLPGVLTSSAAWGDFNNDGLLDILLTGQSGTNFISQVWQNIGNGSFSNINVDLPGLSSGSVAWGDYNNDGFLDILLTGLNASFKPVSQLWHNNGNGTFTQNTNAGLPGVAGGSVAWGDYDNDGRPDILLTGQSATVPISQLWHNNGDGTFTQNTNVAFVGLYYSSIAWGDYDNDGKPDILLTGFDTNSTLYCQLWHNNGDGTFTQNTNTPLPGVAGGSVAWGDYDNDGWSDILITGITGAGGIAQVWHNNGDGTFTQNTNSTLPGIYYSSAAWGDYDNDGWSDFLLTGLDGTGNPLTQVWRNNGDGSFSQTALAVPGVFQGSAVFGDYDNNSKLDILLTGASGFDTNGNPSSEISLVLLNVSPVTDTPPTAPSGLTATIQGSQTVRLSWNRAGDLQTPTNGLSYNIRVGATPGGSDVLAPDANPANGFRRLPQMGNEFENLSTTLTHLPSGHYYWSVQAIDSAFAGSPFAAESTFTIVLTRPVITSASIGASGQFQVQFNGSSGSTYMLQASTDLSQWIDLTSTNVITSGVCQLLDANASSFQKRFYRLNVH
jgi:hypothetical protein